jgi:DNA-binding transcriptional regulator LsrR (DeoR family)
MISDTDRKVAIAAFLRANGMATPQIADFLHVEDKRVSEYLKMARDRQWLWSYTDIPEDYRKAAFDRIDEAGLLETFAPNTDCAMRQITVCDGIDARLACAELAAAETIPGFAGKTIGVAWGLAVLAFAKRACARRRERLQGKFVPMCGDPLRVPMVRASASASAICEILNRHAECSHWESMSGVPAFFPRSLGAQAIGICKENFGGPQTGVDGLITGIGETPLGYDADLLLLSAGVNREDIRDSVVGDLAGVLIPKQNLTARQNEIVADLQLRWTGLTLDHLKKIAKRSPGVVVMATAAQKFDVLMEAIRLNVVTRVYVSRDLFERIKEGTEGRRWNSQRLGRSAGSAS